MKIIKPQLLGFLWRTYQRNGNHLALTGLVSFPFDSPDHPLTEQTMWQKISPELPDHGVWDEGIPKDRGEVLFSSRAFSSDGNPTDYRRVSVQVGPIAKSLDVHGDRHWERGAGGWKISPAQPFIEMPIDFSRAFGGPGDLHNPTGKGVALKESDGPTPLPNIESPFAPIKSPDNRPDPDTLGPLDLACPIRISKAGSYQTGEIGKEPPPLPLNADWTLYNQALPDQWLRGYWKGGEAFVLEGLSPLSNRQEGRLPLIIVRSFVTRMENDVESFSEVPMHPETVWLFPHLGIGVIVHRGSMPLSTDDASEVKSILLAAEDPQDKRSVEHYLQFRNRREARDPKDLSLYGDAPLLPVRLEKDPQANSADVRYHLSGLSDESSARRKKIALQRIEQIQKRQAENPATLRTSPSGSQNEGDPLTGERSATRLNALEQKIEDVRNTIMNAPARNPLEMLEEALAKSPDKKTLKAQTDDKIRKALSRIPDDVLQKKNIKREDLLAVPPPQAPLKSEIQKSLSVEALKEKIGKGVESVFRTLPESRVSTGETSPKLDKMASGFSISGEKMDSMQKMTGQIVRTVHVYPPPPPDSDKARGKRAIVVERLATSRDFRNWELRGSDLSGLDLSKCDFSGADLIGSNLSGSNLSGSRLSGTWAAHANFYGCTLDRVDFSGANLGCSDLSLARGTHSIFNETILSGAVMTDCVLSNSRFEKADFSNVSFIRSKLQDCELSHSLFMRIKTMPTSTATKPHPGGIPDRLFFDEADFSGSRFEKALFMKIDFRRVCFSGSVLSQATFLDCNGPESRFDQATLHKTAFPQCLDFSRSIFHKADLTGANLRGVNFSESDFCESVLNALDGSEGNWQRAKISGSRAIRARFQKTDLRHVDARGTDFRQAVFGKANLLFANFSHASLYKAGFTGAHIDDSTLWAHALTGKTALERQG
ncbi:MAG: DUF2169 family type VI secretion system accessory protein [Leptospirillum sp.]